MTRSHKIVPKPSTLMALVALGLVARVHRGWIAEDLNEAAAAEGVSAQRLGRMVTAVIEPFQAVVDEKTRRGRPPVDRYEVKLQAELSLCRELLRVATSILEKIPLRRKVVGTLVVGAWLRLKDTPGLSQKRFCEALALPTRTLRSWMKTPPQDSEPQSVVVPPPPPPKPRDRGPRRPRFNFDIVLPNTQLAADTTNVSVFGVPLKIIASQDVGGRDQDLLESVIIDDHESSELIIAALTEALTQRQGAQIIVDQGTPYMAQATIEAIDKLESEHAPQPEGDPQAKATIERAFGSVKVIAAPLLQLTDRVAAVIPELCSQLLAKAAARLVITSILRAYQAGARAATRAVEARGSIGIDELARRASQHREQARATDRSARLLLGHIHDLYALPRSRKKFIDSLRRYPIEVLHRAEKAFQAQVHRDDIKDRGSYFAALVRRFHQDVLRDISRRDKEQQEQLHLEQQRLEHETQRQARRESPTTFLRDALDAFAKMWNPTRGELLFGGTGVGNPWLRQALDLLVELHGPQAARDMAEGVFAEFSLQWMPSIGDAGITSVRQLFIAKLDEKTPRPQLDACTSTADFTILANIGLKQRPPPSAALRI